MCFWGLAYLTTAQSFKSTPFTILLFAAQKGFYVVHWVIWVKYHQPSSIAFFNTYGFGDFALFWMFIAIFCSTIGPRSRADQLELVNANELGIVVKRPEVL
mmetsp:Transcript_45520/g.97314  ORF Transcript_45520/g.97314 Transcript_45520/m.97314 type:complete len:101 (+) Transcript_45520:1-303(+)